jgi:hypothetical protein
LLVHEKPWPQPTVIADGAVLYLDDLAVTYLQSLRLIQKLRAAGFVAFVPQRESLEGDALLGYEALASNATEILDSLRRELTSGISSGKIQLGRLKRRDADGEDVILGQHPTVALFELAEIADTIAVDDRFINQHGFMSTKSGSKPILTSLDLLEKLKLSGSITSDALVEYRTSRPIHSD